MMKPMSSSPKSPAAHASIAADAVRALNHATLSTGQENWQYPGDVYSVIGSLSQMASHLGQSLAQAGQLMSGLEDDDDITSSTGDVEADLDAARSALERARSAQQALLTALRETHVALSPLGYKD
jgi:hypothetical protein